MMQFAVKKCLSESSLTIKTEQGLLSSNHYDYQHDYTG